MNVYVTELPLAARVCLSDQSVVCATRISGTGVTFSSGIYDLLKITPQKQAARKKAYRSVRHSILSL